MGYTYSVKILKDISIGVVTMGFLIPACSSSQSDGYTYAPPHYDDDPMVPWQIQFTGELDFSVDADVFDLDLFDTREADIIKLTSQGKEVICYLNAGVWENWRPDKNTFSDEVLGAQNHDWKGERWLDIRRVETLEPVLEKRIELCQQKGFTAVEFDNVDGYQNDTGFSLTYDDQLHFNKWLAEKAHQYNLKAGLKNDTEQSADLEPFFDFLIVEDCFTQEWCSQVAPFLNAGKDVYAIEYNQNKNEKVLHCKLAQNLGIHLIFKDKDLSSFRQTCPELLLDE